MMLRNLAVYPLAKAVIAAPLAFAVSLAVAWVIRRIPGLRRVFA